MNPPASTEIERRFNDLSRHEQLQLLERLAGRVRGPADPAEAGLVRTAADPPIQVEVRKTEEETAGTG